MKKPFSLILFIFISISIIKATPNEIGKWNQLKNHLLNNEKTITYSLMNKFYKIGLKINKKRETYSTFLKLLKHKNIKKPYIYFFLSKLVNSISKEEEFLIKGLAFSKKYNEIQFMYNKLYNFYNKENNKKIALYYIKKSIKLAKEKKDYVELENLYNDAAILYSSLNNKLKSFDFYYKALKYSKLIKKNHSGYIHLNIAEELKTYSKFELVKKHYNEALIYTEKNNDNYLKMVVLSALIRFYLDYEIDISMALYYQELAINMLKANNSKRYFSGITFQIGLVYLKNNEFKKAERYMVKAINDDLKKSPKLNLLKLMELFNLYLSMNELRKIKPYLQIAEKSLNPKDKYKFIINYIKGRLSYLNRDINKAEKYFYKTIIDLDNTVINSFNITKYYLIKIKDVKNFLFDFYIKLFDKTLKLKYLKLAVYVSEINNSYKLDIKTNNYNSYNFALNETDRLKERFKKIYNFYKKSILNKNKDKISYYEKQLKDIKKEFLELEELNKLNINLYKKWHYKKFNINNLISLLNNKELVLKYVFLNNRAYLFYFSKGIYGYTLLKNPSYKIRSKIEKLLEPINDFIRGDIDYLRVFYDLNLSNELYKILLKDILSKYKNIKKLIIINQGILTKLPFETLVMGYKKRYSIDPNIIFSEYSIANYLIERYRISYFNSIFNLLEKKKQRKKWDYFLTAFGYPIIKNYKFNNIFNFDLKKNPLTKKLISTKQEINEIKKILINKNKKVRIFIGNNFTKSNILKYIKKSRVIHFATHYVLNFNYPLSSFIVISNQDNNSPLFYVYEFAKLNLNSDLLILSVCESADTRLSERKRLFGLANIIFSNNISSVLLSLWPVDKINMKIIPIFYKYYLKYNVSLALQKAKLELMKKIGKTKTGLKYSFSHPFLWANYILFKLIK